MSDRPDLEGIAARAEAATEGPWDLDMNKRWGMWKVVAPASDGDPGFSRKVAESFLTEADAEFVAAARVDLPAVIAYALQLEAENQRLRDAERHMRQVAHNMLADMYDDSRSPTYLGVRNMHSRWARFFTDSSITNPASEAGHVV